MLNDTKIHGYLGRDPELKEYRNSKGETGHLVNLSVGVSRDTEDKTDWFNVTIFGKRAEVIDKWFRKGSEIVVWGRMQSETVEKNGQKRTYWNLIGSGFDFCGGRNNSSDRTNDSTDSWEAADADNPF